MKRTQEKIKDIVEPQSFDEVRNVGSDPTRTLAAYRFTDATSDLLARWLDSLADLPRGRGLARALAGARGVGKSHTLSVFGALAGQERLRRNVSDSHVATSARRLAGRAYTVIRVERGTRATLAEEVASALTRVFGGSESQWGARPGQMLEVAASRANDTTLILIVDTAFDCPVRVRRDDGPALDELARACFNSSVFVALALDDDISGADGPNVAIARSYQIDYLDHEHLFRIADAYILKKNERSRVALHDIYMHLRARVPNFNWSEPRFAALYPVHPLVAEVAASVRLHAPAFAFLPFAAEAAQRAVSRPALSLVLLDEVFDRVERDLRKSPELKDAFAVFDDLTSNVVARLPVMQRLEAKLILKSLFILSLDGVGATPSGLCAALLVADDEGPSMAAARLREMLARFAEAAPDALRVSEEAGGEPRYHLQISSSDKFKEALDASADRFSSDPAPALAQLRAYARARFDDWPLADNDDSQAQPVNFSLTWRGSERRGRLIWRDGESLSAATKASAQGYDLEVVVLAPGLPYEAEALFDSHSSENDDHIALRAVWRPGEVSVEEAKALYRLQALRTDASLDRMFGETARAAAATLSAQAQRTWARIYLDDGSLQINGERRVFGESARAALTLAGAFVETFSPHFARLYPQHPQFEETLNERDAQRLVAELFAGGGRADEKTGPLAVAYALPLGLVEERKGSYALAPGDDGSDPAWIRDALKLVHESEAQAHLPIAEVRRAFASPPYGLKREAQNLVLAALVAQRRIDLVSSSGMRITRRDLSEPVRWDGVASVARSASARMDAETLALWARRITGREGLRAIENAESREEAGEALTLWLEEWTEMRLAEKFDSLPDAALTTRAWNLNASVHKRFDPAAEALRAALAEDVTLEEGIERAAEAFSCDAECFERSSRELEALTTLTDNFELRERARAYLLAAETTNVEAIDAARRELLAIARERESAYDSKANERFKMLWREFLSLYAEHYAALHDEGLSASQGDEALKALLAGGLWREFETLSRLKFVNRSCFESAKRTLRRAEARRCDMPVRQLLESQPTCACGFRMSKAGALRGLRVELERLAEEGLASYNRTLALLGKPFQSALEGIAAEEEGDTELAMRARLLAFGFGEGSPPARFSSVDLKLIERAAKLIEPTQPLRVEPPTSECGLLTREELSARVRQWLEDIPTDAQMIELTAAADAG